MPFRTARLSRLASNTYGQDWNTFIELDITQNGEKKSFENFDYMNHWYPVVWAQDVPPGRPTKVSVFDIDYVVSKLDDGSYVCMEDRCPHKSAALSEGRVTAAGYFQCAYHGWSFDGKDGTCVEIPQLVSDDDGKVTLASLSSSSRTSGTARPCQVSQGMVWIFPGGTWVDALAAPRPPTIPELDQPGFRVGGTVVRDFPIDFSILLENIIDPDHGIFAHGAVGFDLFSASSTAPQSLEEESVHGGKGWQITSKVAAVEKVLAVDKKIRGLAVDSVEEDKVRIATTTLNAPNLVYMARRNKTSGETAFVTCFFICPVGLGRSRFLSCSATKSPIIPPRWLMHIIVNNFLDQDTHLLATQQKHVLRWEAKAVKKQLEMGELNATSARVPNTMVRKSNYVYRSPAEKMGVRVGAFFDATLSKVPNRVERLLEHDMNATPQRGVTLDRQLQHLNICPDSQHTVQNCHRIALAAKFIGVTAAVVKAMAIPRGLTAAGNWLSTPRLGVTLGMCALVNWVATKIRREFYFKYTEDLRNRDLATTPRKVWLDKV